MKRLSEDRMDVDDNLTLLGRITQTCEPEPRSITRLVAEQKAKTQAILDRRMPTAQNFDFEKPTRYTQVGPRGPQPEISRRIHEECLEDKNDAAATYRTDADDGGGRG